MAEPGLQCSPPEGLVQFVWKLLPVKAGATRGRIHWAGLQHSELTASPLLGRADRADFLVAPAGWCERVDHRSAEIADCLLLSDVVGGLGQMCDEGVSSEGLVGGLTTPSPGDDLTSAVFRVSVPRHQQKQTHIVADHRGSSGLLGIHARAPSINGVRRAVFHLSWQTVANRTPQRTGNESESRRSSLLSQRRQDFEHSRGHGNVNASVRDG
jgi:hypothetical protein